MPNELVEHVNIADVEENLMLACKSNEPNMEYTNIWYLDIACNNHMCGRKEFFFSYLDESLYGEVKFKNKSKIPVMAKGDISIKSKDSTHVSIIDIYFVLGLYWNLLNIS